MRILGVDWNDLGKNVFGGVHTAGKILASAFGAGALVAPVEQLESPILPEWAKSSARASATSSDGVTVTRPDFIVVVYQDPSKKPSALQADAVLVVSGKRFDGNGYRSGDPVGKTFSFGYDAPSRIEVLSKGKKAVVADAKQVLFGGGSEGKATVMGDDDVKKLADQVVGDLASVVGFNWWSFLDPTALTVESYKHAKNVLSPSGPGTYVPQQAQNPYFAQRHAAGNPLATAAQQRLETGKAQQAALRAQQASYYADLAARAKALAPPSLPPPDSVVPDEAPDYTSPDTVTGYERSRDMSELSEKVREDLDRDRGDIVGETRGDWTVGARPRRMPKPALVVGHYPINPYVRGVDIIGATSPTQMKTLAPRSGITIKTSPGGRTFTSLSVKPGKTHDPRKTLQTAKDVAKRAQEVGKRAIAAADKLAKKAATTKVRGAAPSRKPVKKLGAAALKQLAQKTIDAGKKLSAQADGFDKALKAVPIKQKAAAQKAKQATKLLGDTPGDFSVGNNGYTVGNFGTRMPMWGTHAPDFGVPIIGDDGWVEVVGGTDPIDYILIGAAEFDAHVLGLSMIGQVAPVPDPFRPGLMTDGSPDPAYGGGDYGATTSSDIPGPPDYGANAAMGLAGPPTLADANAALMAETIPDPYPNGDDPTFYDDPTALPLGYVVFDGSRQPTQDANGVGGLGNYTIFFHQFADTIPKGGPDSGYSLHNDGWWLLLTGRKPSRNYSGGRNYDHVRKPDNGMVFESKKNDWGPLMGHPGSWTKGLRFIPNGPNGMGPTWFWYYNMAPDWAKQAVLQTRLNDLMTQYQTAIAAGQTDYTNAQIQDQLDAKDAADQAKIQAAADQQLAIQQQQQDAQQQALQMQQQQAELQAWQQQQAVSTQLDQAQAAYFAAHPEQMFAPAGPAAADEESPDYGAPDYGDEAPVDENAPFDDMAPSEPGPDEELPMLDEG